MKKLLPFIFLSILIATSAQAQHYEWLKKENPHKLDTLVSIRGCGRDFSTAKQEVTDAFARIGVESAYQAWEQPFYLSITVECLGLNSDGTLYSINIAFYRDHPELGLVRHASATYESFGLARQADELMGFFRLGVATVIDEYVRANPVLVTVSGP